MNHEGESGSKRLRLTGARFEGGHLPIDSLIELQRYQEVIRIATRSEWRRDHPGEEVPPDLNDSVSLTIERIDEGSADVFMGFEQVAIYEQYRAEAQDAVGAVDAIILAAYSEDAPASASLSEYSPLTDPELYEAVSQIGATLASGQSIEVYTSSGDSTPATITVEKRQRAIERLMPMENFLLTQDLTPTPSLQSFDESLVGRVTVLDADNKKFVLVLPDGASVHGWYRQNPNLLEDFRGLVNSTAEGPLTRISGKLQYKNGQPFRFKEASSIERAEFDDRPWGARLNQLATLPSGWDDGDGAQITFVALDAAQMVLRAVEDAEIERPGVFPSPEGGVLIEWANAERVRSLEITADGGFEMFFLERARRESEHSESPDLRQAIDFIEAEKA